MKYSNDVAMRWLNRSVATINVTLQLLDIYRYVVFMNISHFQFALTGSSFFCCLSHLLRFYVLLFIRYLILSCDILLSLHLYIQATCNILLFSFYLDD